MKSIAEMNKSELGAFVQEALRAEGIDVVLSGGACVSILSNDQYVSMDLDMIHTSYITPKRKSINKVMQAVGFSGKGRYFKHPHTELFVEFPKGPPAVGEEPVKQIDEIKTEAGTLRIISPTDCVKDRLTWYYHDDDEQCMEQAVLVAHNNDIDLDEVERWSKVEGMTEKFKQIESKLKP